MPPARKPKKKTAKKSPAKKRAQVKRARAYKPHPRTVHKAKARQSRNDPSMARQLTASAVSSAGASLGVSAVESFVNSALPQAGEQGLIGALSGNAAASVAEAGGGEAAGAGLLGLLGVALAPETGGASLVVDAGAALEAAGALGEAGAATESVGAVEAFSTSGEGALVDQAATNPLGSVTGWLQSPAAATQQNAWSMPWYGRMPINMMANHITNAAFGIHSSSLMAGLLGASPEAFGNILAQHAIGAGASRAIAAGSQGLLGSIGREAGTVVGRAGIAAIGGAGATLLQSGVPTHVVAHGAHDLHSVWKYMRRRQRRNAYENQQFMNVWGANDMMGSGGLAALL